VGVDEEGFPIVEGQFHVTFTQTGTFTAVTALGTFQGTSRSGTTPTGERFGASSVEHFNVSANELPRVNEFFKLVCHGSA
jgi:hypothetical protein